MSRTKPFETVWRERLDPQRVHIPRSQYRRHIPQVDVYPLAVYDSEIIALDAEFQETIGIAFRAVNAIVSKAKPVGIKISMRQLIDQIPSILSGNQRVLRVFRGNRLIKEVPVQPRLVELCRRIQSLLLERLLLFEDMTQVDPIETDDGLSNPSNRSKSSRSHTFRRGQKADALLGLLRSLQQDSQKIVIFVRNIPVAEAICAILLRAGLKATYVHGNIEPVERRSRLDEFKHKDTAVLVATRQLFGRGFDLPQADAAVFYSPKDSVRTMWQEMLRIRGTVRKPKSVFILFYAWTAEASKLNRLIRGMLRTGAKWQGYWFRWVYSDFGEMEEEEEPTSEQIPRGRRPQGESATESFVRSVVEGIKMCRKEQGSKIVEFLNDIAERTGFLSIWPVELVKSLLFQLSETIVHLGSQEDATVKSIRRQLAKVFHPDKHLNAVGVEKHFWHELSVALGSL